MDYIIRGGQGSKGGQTSSQVLNSHCYWDYWYLAWDIREFSPYRLGKT